MRIIVTIICLLAFVNGANASISSAMHGNGQQHLDNTHILKVHNHSQHAHLVGQTGGKCHSSCEMHSATLLRRNDDNFVIAKYKLYISTLSFLEILHKLFEVSSSNNRYVLSDQKPIGILPVYALTQRLRI